MSEINIARITPPLGKYGLDLAQSSCSYKFAGTPDRGIRAVLAAVLKDPSIPLNRIHHLPALLHGDRYRLLAIHILACLYRMDGYGGVPVVRRHDEHCINVLTGQQLAVIIVGGAAPSGLMALRLIHRDLCPFDSQAVNVASRQHLRLRAVRHASDMPSSHAPTADNAYSDAVAWRHAPFGPARRGRYSVWQYQRRPGTAQELPATNVVSAYVYLFMHVRRAFCSVVWFNPGNTFIRTHPLEFP